MSDTPIFSVSNKPCHACGGKRNNDKSDKRFGTCKMCGRKWHIVKGVRGI
jgi:hypothetical protein